MSSPLKLIKHFEGIFTDQGKRRGSHCWTDTTYTTCIYRYFEMVALNSYKKYSCFVEANKYLRQELLIFPKQKKKKKKQEVVGHECGCGSVGFKRTHQPQNSLIELSREHDGTHPPTF